ncbi:MAG: HAD family hydrolase [Anaerolineae bacterium]|nr:HAD family hydrolase [Anaerolineae bacterium]
MFLTLADRQAECRAIIFDKDGTLVDLLGIQFELAESRFQAMVAVVGPEAAQAWQEAVGVDLGRRWVDPEGPLCTAPRHEELLVAAALLYRLGHGWHEARALAQAAYDRADAMSSPPYGARLLPGVPELLADLSARGLKLAIATTDRRWRTEASLSALGIGQHFAACIGAEDVSRGKPAPDMVLAACQRLACRPEEAIVVGDSPADLQMGRAAGVAACIGVTTGLNGADRLAALADAVLPAVTALPRLLTICRSSAAT